jgi:hypothetical protein
MGSALQAWGGSGCDEWHGDVTGWRNIFKPNYGMIWKVISILSDNFEMFAKV